VYHWKQDFSDIMLVECLPSVKPLPFVTFVVVEHTVQLTVNAARTRGFIVRDSHETLPTCVCGSSTRSSNRERVVENYNNTCA